MYHRSRHVKFTDIIFRTYPYILILISTSGLNFLSRWKPYLVPTRRMLNWMFSDSGHAFCFCFCIVIMRNGVSLPGDKLRENIHDFQHQRVRIFIFSYYYKKTLQSQRASDMRTDPSTAYCNQTASHVITWI